MKKLKLSLLCFAILFTLMYQSCKKEETINKQTENKQTEGDTCHADTTNIVKTGVGSIKVKIINTADTSIIFEGAEVGLGLTKDSIIKKQFIQNNQADESGYVLFNNLKLNKTYYIFAETTMQQTYYTGDTSIILNEPNTVHNTQ